MPYADNDLSHNDIKAITWSVDTNGDLIFFEPAGEAETESYWNWTLTPVSIERIDALIKLTIAGVADGVAGSFSDSGRIIFKQ